jgi:hypothetical protein
MSLRAYLAAALLAFLLAAPRAQAGGEGELKLVYTANTYGHAVPCAT